MIEYPVMACSHDAKDVSPLDEFAFLRDVNDKTQPCSNSVENQSNQSSCTSLKGELDAN
jgi:hypothetical protein